MIVVAFIEILAAIAIMADADLVTRSMGAEITTRQ
jgi:Tfp pilus assembly protein PilE